MEDLIYSYLSLFLFVISTVIDILFIAILIKRLLETKVSILKLLILSTSFSLIIDLLSIYLGASNLENLIEHYILTGNYFFNILGILYAGSFLIFIDFFENSSFKPSNLNYIIVTLILYSTFVIIHQTLPKNLGLNEEIIWTSIFTSFVTLSSYILPLFLVFVLFSVFKSINNVKKYSFNKKQIKQLNLMHLAIFFYFFVTLISNSIANMYSPDTIFYQFIFLILIPKLSVIFGTIIFILAYVRSKNVAFLQPQRIIQLLVINKIGLPLFSFKFREKKETDSMLFSGGMTAINSMLKETIGLDSEIDLIRFADLDIMVARKENIGVFVLVEKSSKFIKEAMYKFIEQFSTDFKEELGSNLVDTTKFSIADEIVKAVFGLD